MGKNRAVLTVFFEYPTEFRKIIYTKNAVESYHRAVREFTKCKSFFPTDDSIRRVIYLSVKEISKKWTMPIRDGDWLTRSFRYISRTGSLLDALFSEESNWRMPILLLGKHEPIIKRYLSFIICRILAFTRFVGKTLHAGSWVAP